MEAFLTTVVEAGAGTRYTLSESSETQIGRGLDCDVVVDDPLASRVHAVLNFREGGWWLRDAQSRNGTFVNGRKIDEAQLNDSCRVRIGAIEFRFSIEDPSATHETIVRRRRMDPSNTGFDRRVNAEFTRVERLYELSLALAKAENHDEVIQEALRLLHEATDASVVSFWWVDEEGKMKNHSAFPADRDRIRLSKRLTDLVCRERDAVWLRQEHGEIKGFASAICAPLLKGSEPQGALHVFAEKNEFNDEQYEFIVNFANVVVVALLRARKQAALQLAHEHIVSEYACFDELIGESEPMLDLKRRIHRIARASGCVLVRGESGAGKELIARALHKASVRADRPMLSVNCAAIPRDLMESQLFGHCKGAFTGADADHQGYFDRANTGTLFLDEVGELTLEGQAKLLRILEGHPFLPVGGTKEIEVNVRVVAATNRDLREFVGEGKFREDLYYRLSVFELHAPPLRERGDDIQRLLDFFLEHFRKQHGRPNLAFSKEALRILLDYHWPGNVRQLRNVLDSAVVLADGDAIQPCDLGLRDATPQKEAGDPLEDQDLNIASWERRLILKALEKTGDKVQESAKLLGIGRATLYRKIEEYQIPRG